MDMRLLDRYDRPVPRYTSYPTAPHFDNAVTAGVYERWLSCLPADMPLSLYLHVPFCDSLCWFCGCHTKIVQRYSPVSAYLELLLQEIDMVAERVGGSAGGGRAVSHLHWGGGSPTILTPDDIRRLGQRLRQRFFTDAGRGIRRRDRSARAGAARHRRPGGDRRHPGQHRSAGHQSDGAEGDQPGPDPGRDGLGGRPVARRRNPRAQHRSHIRVAVPDCRLRAGHRRSGALDGPGPHRVVRICPCAAYEGRISG